MTTLSAERRSAAEAALDDLESQRAGSWTTVLSTWSADDAAKDAAVYYFGTTVPAALESLRRQLDQVDTEERWYRWVDDATQLHNDMSDVLGYADEWSMASVLRATAEATGREVRTAALEGTRVGLGFFAFVALGFIAWKVLR